MIKWLCKLLGHHQWYDITWNVHVEHPDSHSKCRLCGTRYTEPDD